MKKLLGILILIASPMFADESLILNWNDNSDIELAQEIERRTEDGPFVTIATLGPNVEQYEDADVDLGTNYTYRVRAGNAKGWSGYSNEASGKPSSTPNTPSSVVIVDGVNLVFSLDAQGNIVITPAP